MVTAKNVYCSHKEPRFDLQHPRCMAHNCLSLQLLRDLTPLAFVDTCNFMDVCTHLLLQTNGKIDKGNSLITDEGSQWLMVI